MWKEATGKDRLEDINVRKDKKWEKREEEKKN